MPLPTFQQFETDTAPRFFKHHRGSNLVRIDTALQAYWTHAGAGTADYRAELLYHLAKECRKWLKFKLNRRVPKNSSLFQKRQVAVTNLERAALLEMAKLGPKWSNALR